MVCHDEVNFGRSVQVVTESVSDNTVEVVYGHGAVCEIQPDETRSTSLQLQCVSDEESAPAPSILSDDGCALRLHWNSLAGCRVCEDTDYVEERTECKDGKRVVQQARRTLCNGPLFRDTVTESCQMEFEFPWWAVAVIAAAVLLLIIVIVVVCVRNRRLSHSYELLANSNPPVMGDFDLGDDEL
jgi:hypothetical protein